MKKFWIPAMLISFMMICSCQKKDSAAEQQLAQRKAELDAREKALDQRVDALNERVNGLDERVNALAEREEAITSSGIIQSADEIPDSPQVNAEKDRRIQQLPADNPAPIADPSQVNAEKVEKDRRTQERLAQSQRGPEEVQRQRQFKFEQIQRWRMSGAAPSPGAKANSLTPP